MPLAPTLKPLLVPGFSTRSLLRRLQAYRRARRLIRQVVDRARFVQVQHVSAFGFIAGLAACGRGTPFYLDMGGSGALRGFGPEALDQRWSAKTARAYCRRAEKKLAAGARLLIATSGHLHTTFPPSPAPKVVVSHSTVKRDCIFRRDNACSQRPLQLFVATRIIESKGIQHLIGAVKLLIDQAVDVHLKIAGVGDYLESLQRLTADLGLERQVEFLGGVQGASDELWALFRQADIAVLPSMGHYEGTPRMIIESWAAGAPVVAPTIGGIPSLVNDGDDGLLVLPGDAAALAVAIKRVCTDAALRTGLVTKAYRRVEAMTYEGRLPLLRSAFQEHLPGLLPEESK